MTAWELTHARDMASFSAASCDLVDRLFGSVPALGNTEGLERYARQFVNSHRKDIDRLIESLGATWTSRRSPARSIICLHRRIFASYRPQRMPISLSIMSGFHFGMP